MPCNIPTSAVAFTWELDNHVESCVLNGLLHWIMDPMRTIIHLVECVLEVDCQVIRPAVSRFPRIELEDVVDGTVDLEVNLGCNFLATHVVLLVGLQLGGTSSSVENGNCSIGYIILTAST